MVAVIGVLARSPRIAIRRYGGSVWESTMSPRWKVRGKHTQPLPPFSKVYRLFVSFPEITWRIKVISRTSHYAGAKRCSCVWTLFRFYSLHSTLACEILANKLDGEKASVTVHYRTCAVTFG